MATTVNALDKPLVLNLTREERTRLARGAELEHEAVDRFAVKAVLEAAEAAEAKAERLRELREALEGLRAEVRAANPEGRDLLEDFLAERRAEAARE